MADHNWLENEAQWRRWDRIAEGKGLSSSFRSPPIDAYLKLMGFRTSPIVLWSFCPAALLLGGCFGPTWVAVMWFLQGIRDWTVIVKLSLLTGAMFGLLMAATYAITRQFYALPKWHDI